MSPRFNVAPSQLVLAAYASPEGRVGTWLRWGFVPSREKRASGGPINARAESVFEKRIFQGAARGRRCVIPADGFFEWKSSEPGRGARAKKQPYLIRIDGGDPFAMAGIWERWRSPDGAWIDGCAILTTEPNEKVRALHDRMPVILDPSDIDLWLDPGVRAKMPLERLFTPWPEERTELVPVSTRVNDPANDDAACIERVDPERVIEDEGESRPRQLDLF